MIFHKIMYIKSKSFRGMFLHIFTILKFPNLLVASTHKKEEIKSDKDDEINIEEIQDAFLKLQVGNFRNDACHDSRINKLTNENISTYECHTKTVHNQLTNPTLSKFNYETISSNCNDEHVSMTLFTFRSLKIHDSSQEKISSEDLDEKVEKIRSLECITSIKQDEIYIMTNSNSVSNNFGRKIIKLRRTGGYSPRKADMSTNHDESKKTEIGDLSKHTLRNKRRFEMNEGVTFNHNFSKRIKINFVTEINTNEFVKYILLEIEKNMMSKINHKSALYDQLQVFNKDKLPLNSASDKKKLLMDSLEKCKTLLFEEITAIGNLHKSDKTTEFSLVVFIKAVDSCFTTILADIERLDLLFSTVVKHSDIFKQKIKTEYKTFASLYYDCGVYNKNKILNMMSKPNSKEKYIQLYKKLIIQKEIKNQKEYFLKDINGNKYGIFTGIFLEFLIESIKEAVSKNMMDTSQ